MTFPLRLRVPQASWVSHTNLQGEDGVYEDERDSEGWEVKLQHCIKIFDLKETLSIGERKYKIIPYYGQPDF